MDRKALVVSARSAVEEVFGTRIGLPATAGKVYTEKSAPTEAEGFLYGLALRVLDRRRKHQLQLGTVRASRFGASFRTK